MKIKNEEQRYHTHTKVRTTDIKFNKHEKDNNKYGNNKLYI